MWFLLPSFRIVPSILLVAIAVILELIKFLGPNSTHSPNPKPNPKHNLKTKSHAYIFDKIKGKTNDTGAYLGFHFYIDLS